MTRTLTRKSFVAAAGAATIGAALIPGQSILAAKEPRTGIRSLATLRLADFARCRGERFVVSRAGAAARLDLLEVSNLAPHGRQGQGEYFALHFRQLGGHQLPQNTYRFRNPTLGSLELFIVPGRGDRATKSYTAIINRLH